MTNKALPGRLALCGATGILWLLAGAAVTQHLAAALHYHPALGEAWLGRLYHPLDWLAWFHLHRAARPDVFLPAALGLYGVLAAFFGAAFAVHAARAREPLTADGSCGSARWADRKELEAAGLLGAAAGPAVSLGGWRDAAGRVHRLRHAGPHHVSVLAPTRSGKGVGLILPTLFTWTGAAVVYDQKGELWSLSSGWRARHVGPCYCFAPASPRGRFRFNPLDAVRLGTAHEVGDAQNIANILVDTDGRGLDDHWTRSAFGLLTGLILFAGHERRAAGEAMHLGGLVHMMTDPGRKSSALLRQMAGNRFGPDGRAHPAIAGCGAEYLDKSSRELAAIWSTAATCLSVYRDPIVAASTRSTTVPVEEMVNGARPATVYLVTREADKDRLRPFVRLWFSQLIRLLLRGRLDFSGGRAASAHRFPLLLLLDEFISLGRLGLIQEVLAHVAGYGVRVMTVLQDVSQLWAVYGRDETILANSHIRVLFAPNRIETAEWAGRMLGKFTEVRRDVTVGGGRRSGKAGASARYAQSGRELMYPDEIMRLRGLRTDGGRTVPGEQLLLVAGMNPVRGVQTPYFLDPDWAARSRLRPVDDSPAPPDSLASAPENDGKAGG